MSEELATTGGGLPAQRYNPQTDITAEDIPKPRIKFAQGLSKVVTENGVPYGAIYTVIGQNDQDPQVLVAPASKPGQTSDPVRFYVLSGPRKGFSFKNTNDDLDNTRDGSYPDLSQVKNNDPREVYRTFDYVVAIVDPTTKLPLPHYLMLYRRWGADAAKRINLELMMAGMQEQDPRSVAFTLRALKDSNDDGSFATAIVEPTEAKPGDAELVAKLGQYVGASPNPQAAPSSAPAIEAPALD